MFIFAVLSYGAFLGSIAYAVYFGMMEHRRYIKRQKDLEQEQAEWFRSYVNSRK